MLPDAARPSLEDLISQHDAFVAHADANGVTGEAWEAMMALRDAADFLNHAAEMIADGANIKDDEVLKRVTWARWKVLEAGFEG
jgi:hypothetical protein